MQRKIKIKRRGRGDGGKEEKKEGKFIGKKTLKTRKFRKQKMKKKNKE